MASGIIYLIIIGMWAAYFIPRVVNRHEESSVRAGERYKSAMKVVSEPRSPFTPIANDPVNNRKLVSQRRAIFASLIALFAATIFTSLLNLMSWSISAIPATGIAIYLVAVRRQLVQAKIKARRLNTLQTIMTAEIKIEQSPRISRNSSEVLDARVGEHWIPLADREDPSGVVVLPKDRSGWNPITVPRPTYVNAPKAITPKRIIDLTVPGQWQEEQELLSQLQTPSREDLFDQELAEQAAVGFDEEAI